MGDGIGLARSTFDRIRSSIWFGWLLDNPLLVREIRRRMRNKLLSWSLIMYLIAMGVVSSFIMITTYPLDLGTVNLRDKIQAVSNVGRNIFVGMAIIEALLGLFIAPMISAGLAVQEKEKDTFDFLKVTTLHARTFVFGCLMTTACFLLLAFSCTLPILGLTFIFGGVSPAEILSLDYFLFLAAMAICSWGIFVSTAQVRARGMQIASLVALILLFIFGLNGLFGIMGRGVLGSTNWESLIGTGVFAGLVILFLSVAATRRLYDPQNRLFNYRQYTVFFALVLGLLAGYIGDFALPTARALKSATLADGWIDALFIVGWAMTVLAIILFSAGRFERGDEVWHLRMRWRIFQTLDERIFIYALYIAGWIGVSWLAAGNWGSSGRLLNRFMDAMPVLLTAMLLVWSLCRFVTCLTEDRNRAVTYAMVTVLILWFATLAVGAMIEQIVQSSYGRNATSTLAELLYLFGPVMSLSRVLGDDANAAVTATTIMQAALAVLLLLPSWSRKARSRVAMAYTWTDSQE